VSVGIGLVGTGGHQLTHAEIEDHGARLVGTAASDGDLGPLLENPGVELVSVCVTPTSQRVNVAVAALDSGRHVLVERPAATRSADLARLRAAARRSGTILCERATTAFEPPFRTARELIARGAVGRVVLVLAHKSYPWAAWREQDETVQGGLILQVAVYGLDCVQHVAGETVASVRVVDTTLGDPSGGGLRMAATLAVTMESGAIASVVADYLNPPDSGAWGRDHLVVLGTDGRLSVDPMAGTVEVIRDGAVRRHECPPGPSLLAELLSAISEGRTIDPAPEHLLRSTTVAVGAMETLSGPTRRTSFVQGGWE
jgi:predicted dehydrogenase